MRTPAVLRYALGFEKVAAVVAGSDLYEGRNKNEVPVPFKRTAK